MTTAQQLMSSKVITVKPETTCEEALKILVEHHVTGLPVVDDAGVLVGVISMFDFLKASIDFPGETTYFDGPQLQRMLEKGSLSMESMLEAFVSDFMTRDIITVSPEESREAIIETLKKYRIHRVVVKDPVTGKPLGVVSPLDLL